jgi:hypothetical protein
MQDLLLGCKLSLKLGQITLQFPNCGRDRLFRLPGHLVAGSGPLPTLTAFLSDLTLESISAEERPSFACLSLLGIFGVTLAEVQIDARRVSAEESGVFTSLSLLGIFEVTLQILDELARKNSFPMEFIIPLSGIP